MTVTELIKSKKLDDYHYATLSLPMPDSGTAGLSNYVGSVIRLLQHFKCQVRIGTNTNGLNPVQIQFDWRCLHYGAAGITSDNWGGELAALLCLSALSPQALLIFQNELTGYRIGSHGEVAEKVELGDGGG